MASPLVITRYVLDSLRRLDWDKNKLEKYQNLQLKRVVHNAYDNVVFYHRWFKEAKLYPNDIKTKSDLNKLPLIKKSQLKNTSPKDLISKKASTNELKKITTGGSSGYPFSIYIDSLEDAWRKAIYLRANIVCGQKIRDRWATLIDPQYANGSSKFQNFFGVYVRNIVPITLDREKRLQNVCALNPQILDGFPSALCLLAKDCKKEAQFKIKPRLIFGSGELIDKSAIKLLEQTFDAPYFDQFGCTEIDRSAWQCKERCGYHMDVDSVVMQFVDPAGNEVSAGEKGEIVYTSLFNYTFPILRYNIEDVGVPINDECSCGKKLPLMKVVEGRSNDFITLADQESLSPLHFIEALGAFKLEKEIEQYRVIQQNTNCINILIRKTQTTVDEHKIKNTLLNNLETNIPQCFDSKNSSVTVDIDFVDEIKCTDRGKLNVVCSNVAANI